VRAGHNPKKHYQFIVTNCSIPDAMTAGGGRIDVTSGMLEEVESEDELAGMLAHEIAHDAFAHTGKTISRQMFRMTGTTQLKTRDEVEIALARALADYSSQPLASTGEKILGFSRFDELEPTGLLSTILIERDI
jgi:predicted Zn-dependent protease